VDVTANEALGDLLRCPTWMWRNADVLDFVGWLREHNDRVTGYERKVGFYGLDLYSLNHSIQAVLEYLDKVDPEAARRARYRYGCFEDFGEDAQAYGYAAGFGLAQSCQREVLEQLVELQRKASEYARMDGRVAEDELFFAEQNARLIKNAEHYYRTMFSGRTSSWNLRDRHMFETLEALDAHLSRFVPPAKIIVWEHNSHLGDARATDMRMRGELNVGQLARERFGRDAVLVGFTTYSGTVTAANDWDAPAERKEVRPALPGSYEALFHEAGVPQFLLPVRDSEIAAKYLAENLLERAIGVI
jgi:erythromycin esterase-like protein